MTDTDTPPTAHPFQETAAQMEARTRSGEIPMDQQWIHEDFNRLTEKVSELGEAKAAHSESLRNGNKRFDRIEGKLDKINYAVWAVVILHIIKTFVEL